MGLPNIGPLELIIILAIATTAPDLLIESVKGLRHNCMNDGADIGLVHSNAEGRSAHYPI